MFPGIQFRELLVKVRYKGTALAVARPANRIGGNPAVPTGSMGGFNGSMPNSPSRAATSPWPAQFTGTAGTISVQVIYLTSLDRLVGVVAWML